MFEVGSRTDVRNVARSRPPATDELHNTFSCFWLRSSFLFLSLCLQDDQKNHREEQCCNNFIEERRLQSYCTMFYSKIFTFLYLTAGALAQEQTTLYQSEFKVGPPHFSQRSLFPNRAGMDLTNPFASSGAGRPQDPRIVHISSSIHIPFRR